MRELDKEKEYVEIYIQNSSDESLLEDLKYVEAFKGIQEYYGLWKPLLDKEAQKRGLA